MNKTCKNYSAKINDFLGVINEPNRLKILCLLNNKELCVCEIVQKLSLAQNLVSHHLAVLKNFGLLVSRKDGKKIIYRRVEDNINKYKQLLNKLI